ncbi:EAL domain-containing protein [Ectobacillus funiculus]|uniref:EAL-associated domain-containing protein n=1 Tax=Ectobacillus funiculus TaxID=137993 RepID=A0ABV5WNT4_9BACI
MERRKKGGVLLVDALDVMSNLDQVLPYYQAIFSADEHTVIGYEAVGRIQTEQGIQGLASFFRDESVPEEYRIEVDNLILTKALQMHLETDPSALLFINRNANLLMQDEEDSFLNQLLAYEKQGLDLKNIVLEIREQDFTGDLNQLLHLLTYYRTYGVQLAINKVGAGMSNLERISLLSPDILKVDLSSLRQTAMLQSYQDVLYSISLLARRIGATLLYEDIDAFYQLQYAWRNGGRYYQGDYLQRFMPSFLHADILKDRLRKECHEFIVHEKRKLENIYALTERLRSRISTAMAKQKKIESFNKWLMTLSEEVTDCSFRLYVCDEDGFQKSGNLVKENGQWELVPEYEQKNWSWRPYFLANIMQMRFEKKGRLSDLYTDIDTGEMVRTFSFPIDDDQHYLFIDLSHEFLYEQDALF